MQMVVSHFRVVPHNKLMAKFYILLTMHHVMILVKWPTWRTILFHVFIYIFNSQHVPRTSCSSSGERNCVNTTSGSCHSVSVAVLCAGRKWSSDLHTTRPPTATTGCIDTICLSWWRARCAWNMQRVKNINKNLEKKCASSWWQVCMRNMCFEQLRMVTVLYSVQ